MNIFESLGEIVTQLGTAMANAFTSLATVFYTPGVADAPGELTLVGYLGLGALGISILGFAFRFISGLIKQKMSK